MNNNVCCDLCGAEKSFPIKSENDTDLDIRWQIFRVLLEKLGLSYCDNCIKNTIDDNPEIKEYYKEYSYIRDRMNNQWKKYIQIMEERDGKPLSLERKNDLYERNMGDLKKAYEDFSDRVCFLLNKRN